MISRGSTKHSYRVNKRAVLNMRAHDSILSLSVNPPRMLPDILLILENGRSNEYRMKYSSAKMEKKTMIAKSKSVVKLI